ncbi:MAG: YwiC-like family protein [Nitrospirae bacterium]|nr:YwiC-like family protein [Nitrospirota bacterium]
MKVPVVKEWGSWVVFFSSCLAGLIAGLSSRPRLSGKELAFAAASAVLGLILLINSKNPLASALRTKGKREHVVWLLSFSLTGLALLLPYLIEGIRSFSLFTPLVLSYVTLLSRGKEHNLAAELNGFALLTVSAPLVYFAVTGEMSWGLYLTVTTFFAAGVFKVRMRIRKTPLFRWIMTLYCAAAFAVFQLMNISALLLLPLLENILTAVRIREEKLKTTGNTELAKAVLFIILLGFFWR